MDVRWSKGCDIPISESSHVQPLTSYMLINSLPDSVFVQAKLIEGNYVIVDARAIEWVGLCWHISTHLSSKKALFANNYMYTTKKWNLKKQSIWYVLGKDLTLYKIGTIEDIHVCMSSKRWMDIWWKPLVPPSKAINICMLVCGFFIPNTNGKYAAFTDCKAELWMTKCFTFITALYNVAQQHLI